MRRRKHAGKPLSRALFASLLLLTWVVESHARVKILTGFHVGLAVQALFEDNFLRSNVLPGERDKAADGAVPTLAPPTGEFEPTLDKVLTSFRSVARLALLLDGPAVYVS